jgi:hypothetical protein
VLPPVALVVDVFAFVDDPVRVRLEDLDKPGLVPGEGKSGGAKVWGLKVSAHLSGENFVSPGE